MILPLWKWPDLTNHQIKWEKNLFWPIAVHISLHSSLGFEGLLLAVPALILQLLQLLQDSSGLVGGVDQHAQQLESKSRAQIKAIKSRFDDRTTIGKNRSSCTGTEEDRSKTEGTNADRTRLYKIADSCKNYKLAQNARARTNTVSREIKRLFCWAVAMVCMCKHTWLTAPHIKMKALLGNCRWLTRHRSLALHLSPPPSFNLCQPTSPFESVQLFD